MKINLTATRPAHFPEYWPGQYDLFSHLEFACGIPHVLFVITTLKENGQPNACFHAWSSFSGDSGGYYAFMPGLSHGSHTYKNILRTGEFVINFIGPAYFDAASATIAENGDDMDEIAAGGFTAEPSVSVSCPRLKEAFLSLECRLEEDVALRASQGSNPSTIIVGRVVHIAAEEDYARGLDEKYGDSGFMMNLHAPKDLQTGEGKPSAVAVCKIVRINEAG
ncbi:MAG: flavin reductase family protein [Firmicutes bacterium]|nr:flavin reductase family protein [Bacillota bacterium]